MMPSQSGKEVHDAVVQSLMSLRPTDVHRNIYLLIHMGLSQTYVHLQSFILTFHIVLTQFLLAIVKPEGTTIHLGAM